MKKKEFKYYLVILVFSVFSVFIFLNKINSEYFYQLNFDKDKVEIKKKLGRFKLKIDSFMTMSLQGDLVNKIKSSKQYMFRFKDSKEVYYFSFLNLSYDLKKCNLKSLVWHLRYPTRKNGEIELFEVQLPFKEFKNKQKVLYISTKHDCSVKEGKMFRYFWDKQYSDAKFIGNTNDVLGYSYFNINQELDNLGDYMSSSIILINILDLNIDQEEYLTRLLLIINRINTLCPDKKIFIATPLFRRNNSKFESLLTKLLNIEANNNVKIINLKKFYNTKYNRDCFNLYKMDDICILSLVNFIKKEIEN